MNDENDNKDSSEGGDPPNNETPMRRRRHRRLSALEARALGDLAFFLYQIADSQVPDVAKWPMLKAKLLAWRGMYL